MQGAHRSDTHACIEGHCVQFASGALVERYNPMPLSHALLEEEDEEELEELLDEEWEDELLEELEELLDELE